MMRNMNSSESSGEDGCSYRFWGCIKPVGAAIVIVIVISFVAGQFSPGVGSSSEQGGELLTSSQATDEHSEATDESVEVAENDPLASSETTNSRTATYTPTTSPSPTVPSTSTPTPEPTAYAGFSATVRSNANLRAGPGTDHDIVGLAESGELVTIYRRTDDGWLSISESDDLWIGSTLVDIGVSLDDIPRPGEQIAQIEGVGRQGSSQELAVDATQQDDSEVEETPAATSTPAATPIPDNAGLTKWINYEGIYVGVEDIRWDYSIGYFRAETGKIMVSLYIVILNHSDSQQWFSDSDFSLIDGGREETYGVLFSELEPTFNSCSILPGGKCEGWWTTMIWDRPEVREDLTFVWDDPCFFCEDHTVKIDQE